MKKIISLLIAFSLVFALPLQAYATTDSNAEYFILSPSNKRLAADGTFKFSIRSNVRSDRNFKTISNYIGLEISAQVYDDDPTVESPKNGDDVTVTIWLYRVGYSSPVDRCDLTANGLLKNVRFSVSTGVEYYFIITVSGLDSWEYVKGSGDFSNIYIV